MLRYSRRIEIVSRRDMNEGLVTPNYLGPCLVTVGPVVVFDRIQLPTHQG